MITVLTALHFQNLLTVVCLLSQVKMTTVILHKFSLLLCNILHKVPIIAQLVKSPPAMQETPVRFLGQEDPLEKE